MNLMKIIFYVSLSSTLYISILFVFIIIFSHMKWTEQMNLDNILNKKINSPPHKTIVHDVSDVICRDVFPVVLIFSNSRDENAQTFCWVILTFDAASKSDQSKLFLWRVVVGGFCDVRGDADDVIKMVFGFVDVVVGAFVSTRVSTQFWIKKGCSTVIAFIKLI